MLGGSRNSLLSLVAMLVPCSAFVSGQSPADFINIDCGKPKGYTYNDSFLGITYTSDFRYIDTGEIHNIASSFARSRYPSQLLDLRSFPNGTRNCYTVEPVRRGRKYLVRASFVYGNYDGGNKLPQQFDLYLGVNFWETVAVANESSYYVHEVVTVTTSEKTSVCLVDTGQGTPFISALELRPLPADLYPRVDSSQAWSLFSRKDFGGSGRSTVRYPHDPHDRIWVPYNPPGGTNLLSTSPVSTTVSYGAPPSDVMKTASYPTSGSTMRWQLLGTTFLKNPRFHIFLHFSELQMLKANETRAFSISLNGATFTDLVKPSYLKTTTVYTVNPVNYTEIDLVLLGKNQSTLPPIINAAEVYTVRDTTASETDVGDVDAVMAIKASHKVQKNWTGDPCSPRAFMWDGLNCSYEGFKNLRIVSLNLSSSSLTGELSTSFANLAELRYLDLSRNELTGAVPDTLASLTHLKFLDLTGNKLNGTIPKTLLDRSAAGTLMLRFDNRSNPCNGIDNCEERGKKKANKVVTAVAITIASVMFSAVAVFIVLFVTKKRAHPGNHQRETNAETQTKTRRGSFRVPSLRLENRQFTVDDLAKITDNFSKEIGRGGFGPVYYGVLSNNAEVAVKMLSKSSSQGPKEFQTEACLLTRIHHKNLVSLVGYCSNTTSLALVYEYMAEGSLQNHLTGKASNALSWIERLRISVQAAQGLEYLHFGCKPAIVHRDVKTNNILLNKNLEAKIADFGLSRFFQNGDYSHISTMVAGTPGYIDPEHYTTNKLNEKSDVYSFGIVLLELITGLPAIVKDAGNTDLAKWVQQRFERGEINEIIDKRIHGGCDINSVWKAAETAMSCVSTASSQRPTISDVLILLRDCLEMETINERNKNSSHMKSSTSSSIMEIPPMNISMIFKPSAR